MDTHIIDLPDSNKAPFATDGDRLATVSHVEAVPPEGISTVRPRSADDKPVLVQRKRRKPVLLATAAVLIVGAIGGGFLISPYNTIYPINMGQLQTQGRQMVASVQHGAANLVAPATNLVAPAAKIAANSTPQVTHPVLGQSGAGLTREEQRAEILALRDRGRLATTAPQTVGETGQSEPASVAKEAAPASVISPAPSLASREQPASSPTKGIVVFETGATSQPQEKPAAAAVLPAARPAGTDGVAVALNQPTPVTSQAQPTMAPLAPVTSAEQPTPAAPVVDAASKPSTETQRRPEKPTDPVAVVAILQAAPMAPPEQIEVLNEVARLGIVVRDIRVENAALKARVESTADRFDQAVADFTRRLALAEAHGSLNAAMGADPSSSTLPASMRPTGQPDQVIGSSTSARLPAVSGTRIVPASVVVPGSGSAAGPVRYHVTAASPGLAMLAQVDRSGGEGAQIQVGIGDGVPGYGKVTAIQQRGASWVVQTDKGPDKGVIQ